MSRATREVVGLLIQAGCFAFAVYVLLAGSALPGSSTIARVGIAVLALAVAMLYGEVARQRAHLDAVLAALQARIAGSVPRDDRKAVDTLIRALGGTDAAAREAAHRHLLRLTGQSLPAEAAPWEAWWRDARADFPSSGGNAEV